MEEDKVYKFQEAMEGMRRGKFYQKISMIRSVSYSISTYGYENTFTLINNELYIFNESLLKLNKSEIPIPKLVNEIFIKKQNPFHDIRIISDRIDKIEMLNKTTEQVMVKIEHMQKDELSNLKYSFFVLTVMSLSVIGIYQCIEWIKLLFN